MIRWFKDLFADGREEVKPKIKKVPFTKSDEEFRLEIRNKERQLKQKMAMAQSSNLWGTVGAAASNTSYYNIGGLTGTVTSNGTSGPWVINTPNWQPGPIGPVVPAGAATPYTYVPFELYKISVVSSLAEIETTIGLVDPGQPPASLYFAIRENQFYKTEFNYESQPDMRTTSLDQKTYTITPVILNPDGSVENKIIVQRFTEKLTEKEEELFNAFDNVLQPDLKKLKHKPILEQVKDYIDKQKTSDSGENIAMSYVSPVI